MPLIAKDLTAARSGAAASAERWRRGSPLGPLDGVPFTVKDNIVTAGLPTSWGSPLFRDHHSGVDELPVARMADAGAVLIGKTNLPELAAQGYTDNTQSHPAVIDGQPVGPRGHAVFTAFANIAGLPALALPSAASTQGLPIGFQLVGAPGADAGLLAWGASYERAVPWADIWPRDPI